MIHHVSIPAREPRHVAEVLAELMGGKCHPFGPLEGAFMATSGDAHGHHDRGLSGSAPLSTFSLLTSRWCFGENMAPPHTWPFHVLLSVPLEPGEIERIGAREGWRASEPLRPQAEMQGRSRVLSRHRVLARKPADGQKSLLAGDGAGVRGLSEECAAFW